MSGRPSQCSRIAWPLFCSGLTQQKKAVISVPKNRCEILDFRIKRALAVCAASLHFNLS